MASGPGPQDNFSLEDRGPQGHLTTSVLLAPKNTFRLPDPGPHPKQLLHCRTLAYKNLFHFNALAPEQTIPLSGPGSELYTMHRYL